MSGYFVVRRDVFEAVRERLQPRGYKILLEIVARAEPLKLVELPFVFRDRRQGVSKVSPHVAAEYLMIPGWQLPLEPEVRAAVLALPRDTPTFGCRSCPDSS